jgi:DNA repair protein RecO (recombination protein O)
VARIESDAIVLRTYDLADADRIVIFLTEKAGLVRSVAKGAKRSRSKFGSGLEFLSTVKAVIDQNEERELSKLHHVELQDSAIHLTKEPEVLLQLGKLIDSLLLLIPAQEPNPVLFRLLRTIVGCLTENADALPCLMVYAKVWLLKIAGYLPDIKRCRKCSRVLKETDGSRIGSSLEILCGNCAEIRDRAASEALAVARKALKQHPMAFCLSLDAAERSRLPLLETISDRWIASAIGRPHGVKF